MKDILFYSNDVNMCIEKTLFIRKKTHRWINIE